ncbi:MAG: hypothetical protein H7A09_09980 [Oceanospirillaceae bacterium]|nr:hypothetical protein [Oceanospirillaceae bacterium]
MDSHDKKKIYDYSQYGSSGTDYTNQVVIKLNIILPHTLLNTVGWQMEQTNLLNEL